MKGRTAYMNRHDTHSGRIAAEATEPMPESVGQRSCMLRAAASGWHSIDIIGKGQDWHEVFFISFIRMY